MSSETSVLHENSPRPWWMTALAFFCLGSVVFLVPRDLFFSETRDVEVWLGFEIRGTAALLTAPIHWAIFLLGAWGFWHRRPWILPCAAAYVFYIALSRLRVLHRSQPPHLERGEPQWSRLAGWYRTGRRDLGGRHPSVARAPPNKRLNLTSHRALQISVLPSGHEIKRFQLPGHLGRQLSRDPLCGARLWPIIRYPAN